MKRKKRRNEKRNPFQVQKETTKSGVIIMGWGGV
jgi:hypothetical protein